MSLNILCAICSEYFKHIDVIYSTRCGHVFHRCCLFNWLVRSQTCPQCRKKCLRNCCHQLFANFVGNNQRETELPKKYEWLCVDKDMDLSEDMSFAFSFGKDEEGNDIYAGRGNFNGELVPGNYVPKKKALSISWESRSLYLTEDIEILDVSEDDAEYAWLPSSDGEVPINAFPTGSTLRGEVLYTARSKHNGTMLYGKLYQSLCSAYMPYKGTEVSNYECEVLVRPIEPVFIKWTESHRS